MKIGDLVTTKKQLVSGCQRYNSAVVVSIDPFVLVSEDASMKWSNTESIDNFEVCGFVGKKVLDKCMKRLING
jgi:hypothetical protein